MGKLLKILILIIAILCINLTSINVSASEDTSKWKTVNEYFEDVPMVGMAYGNQVYVAVGYNYVMTSSDGEKWNIASIGEKRLRSVAFNGRIFAAVGYQDIATSTDGVHWTFQDLQTSQRLFNVTWTGTQFVATGTEQTILTSKDGLKWELVHSASDIVDDNFKAGFGYFAYNNDMYIAGAHDNNKKFHAVSKDLKNWECKKIDSNEQIEDSFLDVIWNGEKFISITSKMVIMESHDGFEWKVLAKLEDKGFFNPSKASIAFNGQKYFISFGVGMPLTSDDGINWAYLDDKSLDILHFKNIIWCKDRFYALTNSTLNGGFIFSKDGKHWEDVMINIGTEFNDIIWNGNMFCAVGSNAIFTSKNGEEWNFKRIKVPLHGITWGKGQFVAVGKDRIVMTSPDGMTWTEHRTENGNTKVIWDGSIYVACGPDGIISTSIDGSTWTSKKVISDESFIVDSGILHNVTKTAKVNLYDVSYNGKIYVALGEYCESYMVGGDGASESFSCGYIYSSADLINWKKVCTTGDTLSSITNNGGMFSAVGSTIFYSYNGINWEKAKSKFSNSFYDVIWNGNKLIAVGSCAIDDNKSALISSVDGVNWDFDYQDKSGGGYCLAWNGQNLVSAGKGIKLYSPDDVIKVIVSNKPLVFDVAPVIKDGRTLVPLRTIFEALGAKVEWDAKTKTATGTKDGKKIVIKIDDNKAMVGETAVELDVPATILRGRTFVPLRFIGESFSNKVDWDAKTKTIQITNN